MKPTGTIPPDAARDPKEAAHEDDYLTHYCRIYLAFLQAAFSLQPVGSFHYADRQEETQIEITDQSPIAWGNSGMTPHILTSRGTAQFTGVAQNCMVDLDMQTGQKRHADFCSAVMVLSCLANEGVVAQHLATKVADLIKDNTVTLQRLGGIHLVDQRVGIGPESPPGALVSGDSSPAPIMVQVTSPFFFVRWWKAVPSAPLVREFRARLGEGSEAGAMLRSPNPPRIHGRTLRIR